MTAGGRFPALQGVGGRLRNRRPPRLLSLYAPGRHQGLPRLNPGFGYTRGGGDTGRAGGLTARVVGGFRFVGRRAKVVRVGRVGNPRFLRFVEGPGKGNSASCKSREPTPSWREEGSPQALKPPLGTGRGREGDGPGLQAIFSGGGERRNRVGHDGGGESARQGGRGGPGEESASGWKSTRRCAGGRSRAHTPDRGIQSRSRPTSATVIGLIPRLPGGKRGEVPSSRAQRDGTFRAVRRFPRPDSQTRQHDRRCASAGSAPTRRRSRMRAVPARLRSA